MLDTHSDVCSRLAQRWPIILEDEAQDSVPLQESLLGLLSAQGRNWIRVGDPNQSIMSTFTAADPRYLRRFLERDQVQAVEMAISGRCAMPVIDLANYLVEWTCERHPLLEVRQRAFRYQQIRPTAPGDPQQNPPADQSDIAFRQYNNRPEELADVARRARQFIARYPECTASILVTTNRLGYEMSQYLRAAEAPFDEVLQASESGRRVSEVLSGLVAFLAEPLQRNRLVEAYRSLRQMWPAKAGAGDQEAVSLLLRSCAEPETLLFPRPGRRWDEALPPIGDIAATDRAAIEVLTHYLRRWLRACELSIDQLIMTIAQDIMSDAELAQAQRVAFYLRAGAEQNLDWRLPELARELGQIARGRIKIPGDADDVFEPRSGRISLTTMHRAKGLEWDLVYLIGVDGQWFPHTLEDHFLGEYEFLGGDPAEEARAALLGLVGAGDEGQMAATETAHVEIIAERLRLLYVGITRARRYLVLSWAREIPTRTRTRAVPQARVFELLSDYFKRNK